MNLKNSQDFFCTSSKFEFRQKSLIARKLAIFLNTNLIQLRIINPVKFVIDE